MNNTKYIKIMTTKYILCIYDTYKLINFLTILRLFFVEISIENSENFGEFHSPQLYILYIIINTNYAHVKLFLNT